ncbi:MAG TPA: ABC transporter substrate-binding protein, partial [Burkholderiales bacterium]|nr:ABC transporter substrate-binding protein [Burkholderiales bacterium]
MKKALAITARLAVCAGVMLGVSLPASADKEVVIGFLCDRTGATQTVGVNLCPGYHDYIALVNSKGGVEGYKIRAMEIDHEYKVPQAME